MTARPSTQALGRLGPVGMAMRGAVLGAMLLAALPAANAAPAIRALHASDTLCLAAGDAGLLLASYDGGKSFSKVDPPVRAHFRAIIAEPGRIWLLGGQPIGAQPASLARGVVLLSTDGGRSWAVRGQRDLGWLYGGGFSGYRGFVAGQATPANPGGLWQSDDGGKSFRPVPLRVDGYRLAVAAAGSSRGVLLGAGGGIVDAATGRRPDGAPEPGQLAAELTAAALAEDRTSLWAVGEDARIVRSREGGDWPVISPALPAGLARSADFDAVAVAPDGRVWVAGGLLGVLLHRPADAVRWQRLPAPGPGALHALAVEANTLLVGGDHGCIWRSTDDGKTFTRVHGRAGTDVLCIQAADETALYPAAVLHELSGANVAILNATRSAGSPLVPPAQPLLAAGAEAGASVTTLSNFPSRAFDSSERAPTAAELLAEWSRQMDTPARAEMVKQLALAIRLHRPEALVVGARRDGDRPQRARSAESALVAELALEAADLAAEANALPGAEAVGLGPWRVKRTFGALPQRWTWPGAEADRPAARPGRRRAAVCTLDLRADWAPPGAAELAALRARTALPDANLASRPPQFCLYEAYGKADGQRRTFVDLAARPRFDWPRARRAADRAAAAAAYLNVTGLPGTEDIARLQRLAANAKSDAVRLLAADRLAVAWGALARDGQIHPARQALLAFQKHGQGHPLHERLSVAVLAGAVSGEYAAALLAGGVPSRDEPQDYAEAVARFARFAPWSQWAPGGFLRARGLVAFDQAKAAAGALPELGKPPTPLPWRRAAELEYRLLDGRLPSPLRYRLAEAPANQKAGAIDGQLTEEAWPRAAAYPLTACDPQAGLAGRARDKAAAKVRWLASPSHLLVAFELPAPNGESWDVRLAIDADRDAWSFWEYRFSTRGQRSCHLRRRLAPEIPRPLKPVAIGGRQSDGVFTIELAVPYALLGAGPVRPATPLGEAVWRVQVLAEKNRAGIVTRYAFQGGPEPLAPEQFGLLRRLPAETPTPSGE